MCWLDQVTSNDDDSYNGKARKKKKLIETQFAKGPNHCTLQRGGQGKIDGRMRRIGTGADVEVCRME